MPQLTPTVGVTLRRGSVLCFMLFLFIVPAAYAQLIISVTVTPTSCKLYPNAGTTSCSGRGSVNSDTGGTACLSWSYDGSHLHVDVYGIGPGSPTGGLVTPTTTGGPICPSGQDWTFHFTVSYVAQTCDAGDSGSYPVVFTATKGTSSSQATFTVKVSCNFAPQP
jgi:hypothetical protein